MTKRLILIALISIISVSSVSASENTFHLSNSKPGTLGQCEEAFNNGIILKENFEIKKSIPTLYGDIEKGSSLRMTLYEDHIFILSMFDELSSK